MKSSTLRYLIWLLNLVLAVSISYGAWLVYSGENPGALPHDIGLIDGGNLPAASQTIEKHQDALPSEARLEQVFSRSFAPRVVAPPPPMPPENRPPPVAPTTPPAATVRRSVPPLSSLVELVAIFHSQDPSLSGVVIQHKGRGNGQRLFMQGEKLTGLNATILRIEPEAVRFDYEGHEVSLHLPESSSIRNVPVTGMEAKRPALPLPDGKYSFVVPKKIVAQALARPLDSLSGVRYVLVRKDDKIQGFKLTQVAPSSLPGRYGLKPGDVVLAINGKKIDETFNPFVAAAALSNSSLVQVRVRRGAKELDLVYQIK